MNFKNTPWLNFDWIWKKVKKQPLAYGMTRVEIHNIHHEEYQDIMIDNCHWIFRAPVHVLFNIAWMFNM